jgi:type IV pilus assembly protein PilC
MLSSGVKVSEALRNSAFIAGNEIYKKAFEEMIYKVEKGESLPDCFNAKKDLFPVIVRQMMTVGDETGEPEITMNLLSDFYETELDQSMEMLSTILEPVMIGMMGVVVGVVVLAVFLPVYGLLNKML